MTTGNLTPFLKMNGLGNDFAVFDARPRPLPINPQTAQKVGARDGQIGCDQIIVLEPSDKADVFMRIYNADGSEVDACGNATRCVGMLLAVEKMQPEATIETKAGILQSAVNADKSVTIDMGTPRFAWDQIPLSEEFHDTRTIELQVGPIDNPVLHSPSVVNVGNPHAIFWVDDLNDHDLGAIGPILENHPLFPQRANISLAQITSPNSMTINVWERGAGLTKACGTAACAAAVAAARKGMTDRKTDVTLPGGTLTIEWRESDDHILMTGAAMLDYDGVIDLDALNNSVETTAIIYSAS